MHAEHSLSPIVLGRTESLCPECLMRIPAERIAYGEDVFLEKTCPEHGFFKTIIWRGKPSYQSWSVPGLPEKPGVCATETARGCPFDCGLCPQHRQPSCCVLLEVTRRCNLSCPVCFAESGEIEEEPDLQEIESWYRLLLKSGGPYNIQLSGGEPTLREDLADIIALGKSLGFSFIQLNTNGLKLAEDPHYVRSLKTAGLSCVFLQFDGIDDAVYETIRGRALLESKKAAIAHCAEQELGVVLVPTLIPGVNTSQIGGIVNFAISRMPAIRGVHFQPVSYFGRYPQEPLDADRITIPEVIGAIEHQTGGRMKIKDFRPPGAENAYCSFLGNFVLLENGELKSLVKAEEAGCCCQKPKAANGAQKAQDFVAKHWTSAQNDNRSTIAQEKQDAANQFNVDSLDAFLERSEKYSLCISGMAFQDVWNLDLERLQDCFIHVVDPSRRIIPFCAYNLTNRQGVSLYRPQKDRKQAPGSANAP